MTTSSDFILDPRLDRDTVVVGDFSLCRVLLMNDSHYPWAILVPRRPELSEIYQLTVDDRQQLAEESSLLGKTMMEYFHGDKLNVAALGNEVSQFHVHHIVRYHNDPAWPAPVWGKLQPYLPSVLQDTRTRLAERFSTLGLTVLSD